MLLALSSADVTTFSPVESTDLSTRPPVFSTLPPKTGPCVPAGVLHMDFGGDIANFGDTQQVLPSGPGQGILARAAQRFGGSCRRFSQLSSRLR
jgi:hypothetical protein